MINRNIYVYCEGQTEESFVNNVLSPFLLRYSIYCQPIICSSKRTPSQKFKGGVSTYGKIKKELEMICRVHHNEFVTTLFDYYQMPHDTPGLSNPSDEDVYTVITSSERLIEADIGAHNLHFNYALHEFEAFLFSDPEVFELITERDTIDRIHQIKNEYHNPELINNSVETAPSKRLKQLIPGYAKIRHGTELSELIGIEKIMSECPHFNHWIKTILFHFQ